MARSMTHFQPGQILESLRPKFQENFHRTYLKRLEDALANDDNHNIALTGTYGSGKSSVLNEYFKEHGTRTLRLQVSSLGPNENDASLTNRIQQQIVKQLIYSAKESTLAQTTFRRPSSLSFSRALLQTVCTLGLIAAFLALSGLFPVPSTLAGPLTFWTAAGWAFLVAICIAAGTVVRVLTHEKLQVTDLSAGGATIKPSEKRLTYFDEYLDLIVTFFDCEEYDVVLIEDVDRFNDPKIFEALREVNTLLNGPRRGAARKSSLRFVYAIRDSIFDQLPSQSSKASAFSTTDDEPSTWTPEAQTAPTSIDAAVAETARANRTKFFDVVIPIVPFLSHRNARDVLDELLRTRDILIERGLVDLVSRHCTDMRLIKNIMNEYLVFSERLLAGGAAPNLTPTKLFALVAYKSFHMADFENITRRCSALDNLYDDRRSLVRYGIATREARTREILRETAYPAAIEPLAKDLGRRLTHLLKFDQQFNGYSGYTVKLYVGGTAYSQSDAASAAFWSAVIANSSLTIVYERSGQSRALTEERLLDLFPELVEQWRERHTEEARKEIDRLESEIVFLRSAGFKELIDSSMVYVMPHNLCGLGGPDTVSFQREVERPSETLVSMADRVHVALTSELARDLVRKGYIDLNFSLYAAQFYGRFLGVDVQRFLIQTVQSNGCDMDYVFDSEESVQRLLEELGDEFLGTVSAFNLPVLNWILGHAPLKAVKVAKSIALTYGSKEVSRQFLATYFTSGDCGPQFAGVLAEIRWPKVFAHVALDPDVPEDHRARLFDGALIGCQQFSDTVYDLPAGVAGFVMENYRNLTAFTSPPNEKVRNTVMSVLRALSIRLPSIKELPPGFRDVLIDRGLVKLSAANLRLAANLDQEVSLDSLRTARDGRLFEQCVDHLGEYLDELLLDGVFNVAIRSPEILIEVLRSRYARRWSVDQVESLLSLTDEGAAVEDLADVPETAWTALAEAGLFHPTISNLDRYLEYADGMDPSLASLLTRWGSVQSSQQNGDDVDTVDSTPDSQRAAVRVTLAILNAGDVIPSTQTRASLVASASLDTPLPVAEISAGGDDLFAQLIGRKLVPDNAETFAHLAEGGWSAVKPAIDESERLEEYLELSHIQGMVAQVLNDEAASSRIGAAILSSPQLPSYPGNPEEWRAIAKFGARNSVKLSWDALELAAPSCRGAEDVILECIVASAPARGDAPRVIALLAMLGDPWALLSVPGSAFDVPWSPPRAAVLQYLSSQGAVQLGRLRKDGTRRARVV